MARILTSVNSRVRALIAAVNNSNPRVGNSLWEEPEYDNLTHTHTDNKTRSTVFEFPSLSVNGYFKRQVLHVLHTHVFARIYGSYKESVIERQREEREEEEQSTCCGSNLSIRCTILSRHD